MTVHDNIHIPSESFPNWIWYLIEFVIVLAVALVISWKITDAILPNIASSVGHADALASWTGINIHSTEFEGLEDVIKNKIIAVSNWIYYGFVGAIFLGWYILVRGLVLKKHILN